MGAIALLFRPAATSTRDALRDFWYQPVGAPTASGVQVTTEAVMGVPAVWACVSLISRNVGNLPLHTYRYVGNSGRTRARNHPLYTVLHDRPNAFQTPMEFKQYQTAALLLRGNAYAAIIPGQTTPIGELLPLDPDRVTPERVALPQRGPNGLTIYGLRYRYRQLDNTEILLSASSVSHMRGLMLDPHSLTGVSVLRYHRETFGSAIAEREHGARVFANGSLPGGLISIKGKLSPEGIKRLKADWQAMHGGVRNAHKVAVLEEDATFSPISMTMEDSQWIEAKRFSKGEIATIFSVPPHMIGDVEKTTSWGTGITEQRIAFLTLTLSPWLTIWEECIQRDLVLQPNTFFVEFLTEGLLRADQASRYTAYAQGRQWGWLSVNDVRRMENMDPIPNGDIYLQPSNMIEAGTAIPTAPALPAATESDTGAYALLLRDTAARVVRRETAALSKAAKRCAADQDAWGEAVCDFYADHIGFVSETLHIDEETAKGYATAQAAALLSRGAALLADWEEAKIAELIALAKAAWEEGA